MSVDLLALARHATVHPSRDCPVWLGSCPIVVNLHAVRKEWRALTVAVVERTVTRRLPVGLSGPCPPERELWMVLAFPGERPQRPQWCVAYLGPAPARESA